MSSSISISKPSNEAELNDLAFNEPQKLISCLENYVQEQRGSNSYDFVANKKLLKLYQYYPDTCNADIVAKVMSLSLMRLPSTDYLSLSYLVAGRTLSRNAKLQEIQVYAEMLETGQFCEFWTRRKSGTDIIDDSNFDDCIRTFILAAVGRTFRNMKVSMLCAMLGSDESVLRSFAASNGHKLQISGDSVEFSTLSQASDTVIQGGLRLDEVLGLMDSIK